MGNPRLRLLSISIPYLLASSYLGRLAAYEPLIPRFWKQAQAISGSSSWSSGPLISLLNLDEPEHRALSAAFLWFSGFVIHSAAHGQ